MASEARRWVVRNIGPGPLLVSQLAGTPSLPRDTSVVVVPEEDVAELARGKPVAGGTLEVCWTHDCPSGHEIRMPSQRQSALMPCPWCAAKRARRAEELLRVLVESETRPCRLDHHGTCQEHGGAELIGRCATRLARDLLELDK